MVSSGEVSGCWRPIIVRGKSCETSATLRIRKFAGGSAVDSARIVGDVSYGGIGPCIRGSRRKSARQHCLFEPPPASRQWLAQRQAHWPPDYRRSGWIDVQNMA